MLPNKNMRFIIAVMTNTDRAPERKGRLTTVVTSLRRLPQLIGDGWRSDLVALRNWWRRQRGARADYVIMRISGALPERSPPPRSFLQRQLPLPPRPLTIQSLNHRFQRVADANNARGVVLVLGDFTMTGLARLQNLRRSLTRLRESGKEVIVYTPYLDLAHYYVATAAEKILAPPGAQFDVVGLQSEAVFLRDALERIGVQADVLQVSPYKTAGNMFAESNITPEQKQQMEWLIDDTYDAVTSDLARSRGLVEDEVRLLIDAAPFTAEEALARGLIDVIAYEDEIPDILSVGAPDATGSEKSAETDSGDEASSDNRVLLRTWTEARPLLMEKGRRPTRHYIGVISLDGLIVMGASRQPPVNLPIPFVGGAMAGEKTLVQQLRRAERDDAMAALILHVESGGGSSLASELIWRQITRLARKKPVLAYMGDVAASGGYFVSAGAQHIMSQRSTVTGSIGVLLARMNLEDLFDKLAINRVAINRGAHAGLYSEPRPLSVEERELLWNLMQDTYEQFKAVVSEGRELEAERVVEIAGGRVWTGRQAKELHLVDSHGDFVDAVHMAAELSGLPHDDDERRVRVRNLYARTERYLPPQSRETAKVFADLFSTDQLRALNGRVLLLMPFDLRLH